MPRARSSCSAQGRRPCGSGSRIYGVSGTSRLLCISRLYHLRNFVSPPFPCIEEMILCASPSLPFARNARTTECHRKSVPGTTKHTGCSRTHTREHRGPWREIWVANWALCSGGRPIRRVGATAAAAHHEEGRVGLAARLRKTLKNAACSNIDGALRTCHNRVQHCIAREARRAGVHITTSWSRCLARSRAL
jgi:hypothetical protein